MDCTTCESPADTLGHCTDCFRKSLLESVLPATSDHDNTPADMLAMVLDDEFHGARLIELLDKAHTAILRDSRRAGCTRNYVLVTHAGASERMTFNGVLRAVEAHALARIAVLAVRNETTREGTLDDQQRRLVRLATERGVANRSVVGATTSAAVLS